MTEISIEKLDARGLQARLDDLTEVLHATVAAGASVNFVHPFSRQQSRTFWQEKILPSVEAGERLIWIANLGETLAGTVQLIVEMPPNQRHRCEVSKLLVHPDCRNRGVAKRLMAALEAEARRLGKTLVTLDTRTGDTAEPLYRALGYEAAGVIPGFSRAPDAEQYDSTTYMYKPL